MQVSAINLEVSSKPISNSFIIDLNEPATYELTITNLGESNNFKIYSLVGIDIKPANIQIDSGKTKKFKIEVSPQEQLKSKRDLPLNFIYKLKDSENNIQEESLSINIIELNSAIEIVPGTINPKSDSISLLIKNKLNLEFKNLELKTTSAFFEFQQSFSLLPKETKELIIDLDKEKTKILNAGKYLMNTEIIIRGKFTNFESKINFLAQEDIETIENKEGFFIDRTEIIKKNLGNTRKSVTIRVDKNLLSYLFTSSNLEPSNTEIQNSKVIYTWERELIPNEELKVTIKTNWFYPILIILLIIFGVYLIKRSIYSDLELRKKVSFVKTKGGQFALKVSLIIKSKNYIERIKVVDKLPSLVTLYEKFGAIAPDNIDLNNRRLEYNIASLNKGESRIFTYIIYSKIGVVGRFELPNAHAIYEKEGKVKEATSNRSFYINEPDE